MSTGRHCRYLPLRLSDRIVDRASTRACPTLFRRRGLARLPAGSSEPCRRFRVTRDLCVCSTRSSQLSRDSLVCFSPLFSLCAGHAPACCVSFPSMAHTFPLLFSPGAQSACLAGLAHGAQPDSSELRILLFRLASPVCQFSERLLWPCEPCVSTTVFFASSVSVASVFDFLCFRVTHCLGLVQGVF